MIIDIPFTQSLFLDSPKKCGPKCMGFYLSCSKKQYTDSWAVEVEAELRIINYKDSSQTLKRKISPLFYSHRRYHGYRDFIQWTELTDPENGFIRNDTVTFEIEVIVNKPKNDGSIFTDRIDKLENELNDLKDSCKKCNKLDNPQQILICDKCEHGWHVYCLTPPLDVIPEGDF